MATSTPDLHDLQNALQIAALKCSERCLYQSAKWAAELLTSMPPLPPPSSSHTLHQGYLHPTSPNPATAHLEMVELSQYLLAKSYFDVHEYDRSSFVLQTCKSPKSIFLHLYARYIAGEKRRDEDSEMVLGPMDGAVTVNKELPHILSVLEQIYGGKQREAYTEDDAWLLFLYGIVLRKMKNEEQARSVLITSVKLYPYNWSAWQELGATIGTLSDLNNYVNEFPANIMTNLFVLSTNQELYQTTDPIHRQLDDLLQIFPTSSWLKTQRALLHYHARDFDEAEAIFDGLVKSDPHRLDALDHYSNILYVMERRPKLGFLAQLASSTDKFRPETCCVVGNYYSLKSEHEKAVMYFRRALTLDRSFLSAWTLMGHEYVEMKNTHAAIEAYRRAVDVNRKDYRAWYGLGLSYEVLEMHYYALFYFQRAAALRPYDPAMWQAMGSCFDRMERFPEAIKAFKRSLISFSPPSSSSPAAAAASTSTALVTADQTPRGYDPAVMLNIGTMYEKLRKPADAAKWMEATLLEEANQGQGPTAAGGKARIWLARWEYACKNYKRAGELADELCSDGQELEEAKALLRDIRARFEAA